MKKRKLNTARAAKKQHTAKQKIKKQKPEITKSYGSKAPGFSAGITKIQGIFGTRNAKHFFVASEQRTFVRKGKIAAAPAKSKIFTKSNKIFTKERMLLLIALIIIAAAITTIVFVKSAIIGSQRMGMDVIVGERLSLNLDSDAMHFGAVAPGNCASRGMFIENSADEVANAVIILKGSMAAWVEPTNKTMILQPSEPVRVSFYVCVPPDAAYGNYTGSIIVLLKRMP